MKTSSPIICDAQTATLTAEGCAGSILWSNGSTGSSIVVTKAEHIPLLVQLIVEQAFQVEV